MKPMPVTDKIAVLDLVELTEPFDGIPAGATGGVLGLRSGLEKDQVPRPGGCRGGRPFRSPVAA